MALLDINWKPESRELRQFGALFCLFAAGFGGYGLWAEWPPTFCWAALTAAVAAAAACVLWPRGLHPLYVTLMAITLPIGLVVSTTLMAIIFFAIVTPIGLLLRLFGHNPMAKHFDPSTKTYWIKRKTTNNIKHYFRQY